MDNEALSQYIPHITLNPSFHLVVHFLFRLILHYNPNITPMDNEVRNSAGLCTAPSSRDSAVLGALTSFNALRAECCTLRFGVSKLLHPCAVSSSVIIPDQILVVVLGRLHQDSHGLHSKPEIVESRGTWTPYVLHCCAACLGQPCEEVWATQSTQSCLV